MPQLIPFMLISYLSGSIPTGKLLGTLKGLDIQKHGSGNIGFANSVRVLGWRFGVIVLIVDVTKGLLPVLLALQYTTHQAAALCGIAAIAGHVYPVWLRFRGGKGVATGVGALAALSPVTALLAISTYCVTFAITRTSGISSLIASWSLVLWCWWTDPSLIWFCCLLPLICTYTHRNNLRALHQSRKAV